MGKTRRIVLTNLEFMKVGEATDFFAVILNRYQIGELVIPEDAAHLSALLDRHDEREEKIGTGIVGFKVNYPPKDAPPFSKRCFWVVRTDGSEIDFSIGHCLKPNPSD